jgi:hypothetical protein
MGWNAIFQVAELQVTMGIDEPWAKDAPESFNPFTGIQLRQDLHDLSVIIHDEHVAGIKEFKPSKDLISLKLAVIHLLKRINFADEIKD